MLESIYAEAFIHARLKADATLIGVTALNATSEFPQIYRNKAKQNAPRPLLIYSLQAPTDYNSANKARLFTEYRYQVRVVGEVRGSELQNATRVYTAANQMDASLNNVRRVSFTVGGVTYSYNVWRENELPVREEEGETADVDYRNYGGIYVVQVF